MRNMNQLNVMSNEKTNRFIKAGAQASSDAIGTDMHPTACHTSMINYILSSPLHFYILYDNFEA